MTDSARSTFGIIVESDEVAQALPVQRALRQLKDVLKQKGVTFTVGSGPEVAEDADKVLLVGGLEGKLVRRILAEWNVEPYVEPESLCLRHVSWGGQYILVVNGSDARGLTYAILELVDRVEMSDNPLAAIEGQRYVREKPANRIRSVVRFFVSEAEDKPWFYDREFWGAYLADLVRCRFNRFSLTIAAGYDSPHDIRDSYMYFPYPFLVDVPGYYVKAVGLMSEERTRNLETLQFISSEAEAVGLDFYLGIWNQQALFRESPDATYPIEGITPENHASYCRDALRELLAACPAIKGVTLRINHESGVVEKSYTFWSQVFDGVLTCGRRIRLDLRAKGIDEKLIGLALEKGIPTSVSTKYSAEHMGLPYHAADIREFEKTPRVHPRGGVGGRRFTRYGYADLLREDREYDFHFRLWPGTQRVLLWADPAMAAAYSRESGFCGSLGLEICEPLTFKGRRGSGQEGGRNLYLDRRLSPPRWEYEKYRYAYRLWGRMLYDPDSEPESWRRELRQDFGRAAGAVEGALSYASGILPTLTTAHLPGASFQNYWPEMYANLPITDADSSARYPYRSFEKASPLDPVLFYRVGEYADDLLTGDIKGKVSPLAVAEHLFRLSGEAEEALNSADTQIADASLPAYRRVAVDVRAQVQLGRFFGHKLHAGVAYAVHRRTGDLVALEAGVKAYRRALGHWDELVMVTQGIYREDLVFGRDHLTQRGHWIDRREEIAKDIQAMEDRRKALIAAELGPACEIVHTPVPGIGQEDQAISVTVRSKPETAQVLLHHRTGRQGEFRSVTMAQDADNPLIYRAKLDPGSSSSNDATVLTYYVTVSSSDGDQIARSPDGDGFHHRFLGQEEPTLALRHDPPEGLRRGKPFVVTLEVDESLQQIPLALLHYRHVNQAQYWRNVEMEWVGGKWRAAVPAEYTDSTYPLMYFFEVRTARTELLADGEERPCPRRACLLPGFDGRFLNRPYFVAFDVEGEHQLKRTETNRSDIETGSGN